jgi:hypothetical protein
VTTVAQQVEATRRMLRQSQTDEISVLDQDYAVGDDKVYLRYPKPNVQQGTIISVGLNTFYVLQVLANGASFTVMPAADGGGEYAVEHGEIIRIRPAFSTFSIFAEWSGALTSMSSPANGLFGYGVFDSAPDFVSNVYPLPTTGTWPNVVPIGVASARYHILGSDAWQELDGVEYVNGMRHVRVYGRVPDTDLIHFILTFKFTPPTSLSQTTASLGLSPDNEDIPSYGAAQVLALGDEGRRNQPQSQGDPRRATEVQAGANVGVSRAFGLQFNQRVREEQARQRSLYPIRRRAVVND